MGLRNYNWLGHSLIKGAKLIGANPDDVVVNGSLNIQAAAALLSEIADSMEIDRSNLNNRRQVLEKFSGIHQKDVKPFYSFGVFDALSKGESVQSITIASHPKVQMYQFGPEVNPKSPKKKLNSIESVQSADYPPAVWKPSPNFTPSSIQQLFWVVHVTTQGSFAGSVSWLRNKSANGSAHYVIRSFDGVQYNDPLNTAVNNEKNNSIPIVFRLSQNFPNPFNPSTTIEYQIPKNEFVPLKIYDVLGREVAALVNEQKAAGSYNVELNTSKLPEKLTSGVYFYRLKAGSFTQTKKLILMK